MYRHDILDGSDTSALAERRRGGPPRLVVRALLAALVVGVITLVALPAPASAHTPIQDGAPHGDAADALVVKDPGLSQVAYQDMAGRSAFWLAVDLRQGESLYVQLGTPDIARLASYRPQLALVGPGMGDDVVPFDVPAGAGVTVLDPTGPPSRFDEMFTGTKDLIWVTRTLPAPAAGRYFVVAYGPPDVPGKVFVTIGLREQFGLNDLLTYHDTLRGVRAFHEVSRAPLPPLPAFLDAVSLLFRCFNPGYPRPLPGMWPTS
jgi:hypothetical protein